MVDKIDILVASIAVVLAYCLVITHFFVVSIQCTQTAMQTNDSQNNVSDNSSTVGAVNITTNSTNSVYTIANGTKPGKLFPAEVFNGSK